MDWEGLKRIAFGPLSLHPDQFWQLTPTEFTDMVEGYKWRAEQAYKDRIEIAWLTAHFQRLKRLPSLDKLLKDSSVDKPKISKEERERKLAELKAKFRR